MPRRKGRGAGQPVSSSLRRALPEGGKARVSRDHGPQAAPGPLGPPWPSVRTSSPASASRASDGRSRSMSRQSPRRSSTAPQGPSPDGKLDARPRYRASESPGASSKAESASPRPGMAPAAMASFALAR